MPVPGILLSPDPLLSAFLKPSVVFVFGLALIVPPCLHRTWLDCLRSRPPPWSLVFLASHRVARFPFPLLVSSEPFVSTSSISVVFFV